jgi:uncharacterized protein YcfJ
MIDDRAMCGHAPTGFTRRFIVAAWLPGSLGSQYWQALICPCRATSGVVAGFPASTKVPVISNFPQEIVMNALLRNSLVLAGVAIATQAVAQVTFFENEGFQGQSFTTKKLIGNFDRSGFNDRASSVVVARDRWEVCEEARFNGQCVVLRPGRYPSLAAMGLGDGISSARVMGRNARIDDERYAPIPLANRDVRYQPAPPVAHDYRRRDSERLFEANVSSVRAVVGPPEQRCWVERERVVQDRGGANVPGVVLGSIIGGVLGHQVGGGRGQDVATALGAVTGAVVGANVNRNDGQRTTSQDVRRCENVASPAKPAYWDVTYNFRGQEHRVQMTASPGPTVTVNEEGEPRS